MSPDKRVTRLRRRFIALAKIRAIVYWLSMRQSEFSFDDLVQEFYGLDSDSMSVDSVSIMKSGRMYRWTETNGYVSAQLSGPDVQAEVTRHFGLTYLVAVQPDASTQLRLQVMRELRATAEILKGR